MASELDETFSGTISEQGFASIGNGLRNWEQLVRRQAADTGQRYVPAPEVAEKL